MEKIDINKILEILFGTTNSNAVIGGFSIAIVAMLVSYNYQKKKIGLETLYSIASIILVMRFSAFINDTFSIISMDEFATPFGVMSGFIGGLVGDDIIHRIYNLFKSNINDGNSP